MRGKCHIQADIVDVLQANGGEWLGIFDLAYRVIGSRHVYTAINRMERSGILEVHRGKPGRCGPRTRIVLKGKPQ